MRQHLKTAHNWRGCAKPGRPTKASLARGDSVFIGQATREPVYCQTFHKGNFVRYFEVAPPGSQPRGHPGPRLEPLSVRTQVKLDLAGRMRAIDADAAANLEAGRPAEVNPWLEVTRWSQYLRNYDLHAAKRLIDPPRPRAPWAVGEVDAAINAEVV